MDDRATLARDRYRLLLAQLRKEWLRDHDNNPRGFLADAGRRLGVSGEYLGMIEDGKREGAAPVDQAVSTMGIDDAFFYKPFSYQPHYTDFIGTRVERDAIEMAGVTRYFARNPHHERFRATVNRHLNANVGDVAYDLVKSIVRGLEDLEGAEAERQ